MKCHFCQQSLKSLTTDLVLACDNHFPARVTYDYDSNYQLRYMDIEKEFEDKIISIFIAFNDLSFIAPNHMEIGYFSNNSRYTKVCVIPFQNITPENCQELFKRIMDMKAFI